MILVIGPSRSIIEEEIYMKLYYRNNDMAKGYQS